MTLLTLVLWLIVIAAGAVLEGFGITHVHDWTFSALVRKSVPWVVRLIVWLWLGFHFLIQKVGK
jgi:hypothetical protein